MLSFQSCPTLCDTIDSSPPGFPIPGILQARTLEWVAISFSNAWKWKEKVKLLSRVRLLATHGLQPTRLLRPWDFPGNAYNQSCQEKWTNISALFHVATCGTPRDQGSDPNLVVRCWPCLIWQRRKPVLSPLVFSSVLTVLRPGIFQVYLQMSHLVLITLLLGRWYKPFCSGNTPTLHPNNFSDHLWFVFPFHRKSIVFLSLIYNFSYY